MQRRFQPFVSWVTTTISHMVGRNPNNTVFVANVWSFDIFINSVWASSFHLAGVVSVWIFSVVVDLSQSLQPAYLLL